MLQFNIEYYRAFYYTATFSSISKAAEALYISQPAVSTAIRNLENHLSVKLFVRRAHGMELTPEGKSLFRHVSAAFGELITGEEELRRLQQYQEETIRIAATETPLYHLLLPSLAAFRKRYPGISFQISGTSTVETLELLEKQSVDFAMAVTPFGFSEQISIKKGPVFRDVLIAGPAFSELRGTPITAQKLSGYPLITVAKGTSARIQIDRWFAEQGILFQPAFTVNTSSMVLPFVKENLGIGIVPEYFAAELRNDKQMYMLEQTEPFPPRQICIAFRESAFLSEQCRNLIDELLKETGDGSLSPR